MILQTVASELNNIVRQYSVLFSEMSDADLEAKPNPEKWSRKEVIGHLIDSSQNNLRRFITSQYEPSPPNIIYAQDFWVAANAYRKMPKSDIIQLWRLLNERICAVLIQMPEEHGEKLCNTGRSVVSLVPVKWIAQDYVVHLKHHINQIIPGSFDVKYPQQ